MWIETWVRTWCYTEFDKNDYDNDEDDDNEYEFEYEKENIYSNTSKCKSIENKSAAIYNKDEHWALSMAHKFPFKIQSKAFGILM